MKIVWLCNTELPEVALLRGRDVLPFSGWVSGLLNALINRGESTEIEEIQLCIICPAETFAEGTADRFSYYTFVQGKDKYRNSKEIENYFTRIIGKENPDVIQLFGSEFVHALSMLKAAELCGKSRKTVLHIQGLTSIIQAHIYGALPNSVKYGYTLRDVVKKDNLFLAKKKMKKRGNFEKEIINKVNAVMVRTEWDSACIELIDDQKKQYHCNEILRTSFYDGKWEYSQCKKHSIFFSQPMTHVKAFYQLLKAFPKVLERFPDAQIYTTGKRLEYSVLGKMKQSAYQNMMADMISKNNFQDNVHFLGQLDEEQMKKEYLSSNVFVITSAIENSPNSLGEAMMLGVPCISSDVGGVRDMIVHGINGYLYPFDEEYMLSWYIIHLFENPNICSEMSTAAQRSARIFNNRDTTINKLIAAYKDIASDHV